MRARTLVPHRAPGHHHGYRRQDGLAAANIVVGLREHSTSVAAVGFEFAGDVLASTIVFVAMTLSARRADDDHPYGHGRIETLSAFIVGGILTLAGTFICYLMHGMMPSTSCPQQLRSAVVLTRFDPTRFLAADHYGGFVVGIVVVLTGVRVARDASLELSRVRSTLKRDVPWVADVLIHVEPSAVQPATADADPRRI